MLRSLIDISLHGRTSYGWSIQRRRWSPIFWRTINGLATHKHSHNRNTLEYRESFEVKNLCFTQWYLSLDPVKGSDSYFIRTSSLQRGILRGSLVKPKGGRWVFLEHPKSAVI